MPTAVFETLIVGQSKSAGWGIHAGGNSLRFLGVALLGIHLREREARNLRFLSTTFLHSGV
jgi:hypothetical protein